MLIFDINNNKISKNQKVDIYKSEYFYTIVIKQQNSTPGVTSDEIMLHQNKRYLLETIAKSDSEYAFLWMMNKQKKRLIDNLFLSNEWNHVTKIFEQNENDIVKIGILMSGFDKINKRIDIIQLRLWEIDTHKIYKKIRNCFNYNIQKIIPVSTRKIFNIINNSVNNGQNNGVNNNKKYIISKGCGGLGDILNVLVRSMYYSDLTNRDLIVDWRSSLYDDNRLSLTKYDNQQEKENINSFWELFDIKMSNKYKKIDVEKNHNFYPDIWNVNNIHLGSGYIRAKFMNENYPTIFPRITLNSEDKNRGINFSAYNAFIKKTRTKIFKYEDTLSDFYDYYHDIVVFDAPNLDNIPISIQNYYYRQIKPSKYVNKKVIDFYIDNMMQYDKNIIGVHYRHGNGEKELLSQHDLFDKYFNTIDHIINYIYHNGNVDASDIKIFLATDSVIVTNRFEKKYKDRLITYSKWLPDENSGPIHKHGSNRNRLENAFDAVTEMVLLSKCNYLVFNYSSFNWYSIHNSDLPVNKLFFIS